MRRIGAALTETPLRVGIVGCGLIGRKRAEALGVDRLVCCFDTDPARAEDLARSAGAKPAADLAEMLSERLDVVIVATTHDGLAGASVQALDAECHVLVEKPGGLSPDEIDRVASAAAHAGRLVKVGFNHRFYPAIARAVGEFRSGVHGEPMYLRGRYGHGGRLGYEHEWRAQPRISGGGELIDQGMHLLDISYWALGDLPLQGALVRTSYWDMAVDDNAVLTLGDPTDHRAPWSAFHVSCSEWKNEFCLELYATRCKLSVTGLARSYGHQTLRIYRMAPEMGPPELEEIVYPPEDVSWAREWDHFRDAILSGDRNRQLLGDLASARYGLERVGDAYRLAGYRGVTGTAGFPAYREA